MNRAGRSRNARLNQAAMHVRDIAACLGRLQGFPMNEPVILADDWQDCRNAVEQLVQCFHEANAYNNTLIEN